MQSRNRRSPHPLDLTSNCQFVRIGYLSDHLNGFVIYSVDFEPWMGATVRVAPSRAAPGGLPAFHHCHGYPYGYHRLLQFIRT
jgi:hypothetical protein